MARLYADEDIPYPLVEKLRRLGHDVLTTLEAGRADKGVKDSEQLAFATNLGRAILTPQSQPFRSAAQAICASCWDYFDYRRCGHCWSSKPHSQRHIR